MIPFMREMWWVFKPAVPIAWKEVRKNWLVYTINGLLFAVTEQWSALFLLALLPAWGAIGHLSGRLEAQIEMRNRRNR